MGICPGAAASPLWGLQTAAPVHSSSLIVTEDVVPASEVLVQVLENSALASASDPLERNVQCHWRVKRCSPCSPPLPEHVFTLPPCPSGHRLGIDLLRFRAGMVDDESWWNVSARWCKKRIRAISRRVTQNNQDRCFWAIYRILTCCVSSVRGNI